MPTSYQATSLSWQQVATTRWFAFFALACVATAGLIWTVSQGQAGYPPLLIALFPLVVRAAVGHSPIQGTSLDIPVMVFIATALLGVWVAYDRAAALNKFWLLAGALLLFYALAGQPAKNLELIFVLLAGAAVLIALFFLLSHDWRAYPIKFQLLHDWTIAWTTLRPTITVRPLHPNIAGGLMAMLWPFIPATAVHNHRQGHRRRVWLSLLAALFVLIAILFTGARGAWLSLLVAAIIWLLWQASRYLHPRLALSHGTTFLLLVLIPLFAGFTYASLNPGAPLALLEQLPDSQNVSDRLALDQHTIHLIADFPFTGGGLGAFPALYSQYILLIPVYFLPNGHNIFLDAVLEQGILGGLALLAILVGSGWLLIQAAPDKREPAEHLLNRWTVLAGLLVMGLHGLVEDTVYGSPALILLFLFPGLAVALSKPGQIHHRATNRSDRRRIGIVLATLVALISVSYTFHRPLRAAWYANLGSVEMAQVELADWPTGHWADGQKLSALGSAEKWFNQSLRTSPTNRTAHYRLGLIEMLRRNYDRAVTHLETAYRIAPEHPGVTKALAFSYSWSGRTEDAVRLLIQLPGARHEMRNYISWWQNQGRPDLAALASEMVVRLDEHQPLREQQ